MFRFRTRWRRDGGSASGPLLGDVEVAELVDEPPVRGEVGLAGCLDGLESGRPARRGVAALLLGAEVRRAQPVVVLGFGLQAAERVLLRPGGHGARPPVLPDPLPAGDAVAAQQGGQEHGACGGGETGGGVAGAHETARRRPRGKWGARPRPPRRRRPSGHSPMARARSPASLTARVCDAGSAPAMPEVRPRRRAPAIPARGYGSREKRLARSRLADDACGAERFKRVAGATRAARCSRHGADPELLREAAGSGRHPGQRDGAAAAGAGRGGQR